MRESVLRRVWRPGGIVVAVGVVVVAGLGVPAASAESAEPDWRPCDEGNKAQCATLPVPIDHDDPDGASIELSLARLPAQDPEKRRGTVVFHPGGPAEAVSVLTEPQDQAAFEELTRWFDVVTFDSRGFGGSGPMCDPDKAPPVGSILDSAGAYADQRAEVAAYAKDCRADQPKLAGHTSAEDAAHDIDAIRRSLGEEKIYYYGNSYGSVFGQEYAELYGEHLERLYLDSVADHTVPYWRDNANAAKVMEDRIPRFARWCDENPKCALRGEDVLEVWDEVVAAAEDEPLPTSEGGSVSHIQIRTMSTWNLEFEGYGEKLAQAFARAREDGTGDGFAEAMYDDFRGDAGQVTWCADSPVTPDSFHALRAIAEQGRDETPRVGWLNVLGNAWRCAGWPRRGSNPPSPLDAEDAPPALVVNSTLDAGTHLAGARNVASQLPGSGFVTVNGDAHAAYWLGNACVREVVHRYLLDGALPEPGTECDAEPRRFAGATGANAGAGLP
ncbi:alpha/beta hydrolase [Stackebrandtia nassauensis]|uniref:TAP domain protein n=1 Tax=Stackebrandtia nassauensis (strain DSM 44728 / CIP 108903 / NRRL B-16338 / NBRC 102104 / LLR-40K-21) TaxID=446470 RepID=D3QBP5_STANL|nr:alpha/beta hydrolase [Stackebrandtia nassauensis]ADD42927.1 TAP domain protein [Stackebrandtia nassauensis DSM 44728]